MSDPIETRPPIIPALPFGSAAGARTFRAALVVALGLAGVYLCYRLAVPFFTPIAAALILAVLFTPLHHRVQRRIKGPSASALVSVLSIALLVLVLLIVLVAQLVREAAAGAVLVRNTLEAGLVKQLLADHPTVAPLFQGALERLNAANFAADAAAWLTNASASMLRGSVMQAAGTLLMFYLLFYFLRDRAQILGSIRSFLPFTKDETDILFTSVVDTVYATVYGIVVTGVLLGLIGGMIFAAVGLPAPFLWGTVMAVFAILPVLGIGMIWIPAAAWLGLNGDWVGVVIMTVAFTSLSLADFMLYPYLVANRAKLHTAVAFIAAIGGLIVFGAVGFVFGPIVVSLTIALKDVLAARAAAYERGQVERGPGAP